MGMMDKESVINEINELMNNYPVYVPEAAKRGLSDALNLLKSQGMMLEMACKVIGYSGLCNTELCTEHCDTNGKYKCVEHWLEKEVSKGQ